MKRFPFSGSIGTREYAWLLILALCAGYSTDALAHVKWFAPYDLTSPPRSLSIVVSDFYFVIICIALLPIMGIAGATDNYLARHGSRLNTWLSASHEWVEPQFFRAMQIGALAFFTAIFVYGNVLLTPELNVASSDRDWVEWLQFAIALTVVSRHTAFLAGIGIVILYGIAMYRYGVFHLLDYPIFLGLAGYIFIISLFGPSRIRLATTVLRTFTGITLMWASIEKFAYPNWSLPLLEQNPTLSFGFNPDLYMVAAGFIEFTAAFLLVTGALASRVAAAILIVFFIAAIPVFGMVDAIGHAVIILVLATLIFSQNPTSIPVLFPNKSHRWHGALSIVSFYTALVLMTALFYGGHWLSYGT